MMYIIQYVTSIVMIFFSGFATWYEGSELRDKPWEWGYSAVFSKIINGKVMVEKDILSLDHFIYAAKFKPMYPLIFTISLLYLAILIAWTLLRFNKKIMVTFHMGLGVGLLMLSLLIYRSPSMGLELFTVLFLITGISNVFTANLLRMKFTKYHKSSGINCDLIL
ncbi:DUF4306 domain-containing protein [Guptibacillus hwajinpoensis]|uniref:DUF4306 domain-containing protein n=1 Tax=Guptibacillus hwajinpoensis TaxID=208199 RepID=UPI001CD756B6|nr:DUF4306 domain-containing protein [Pseudalkalibacillus hwajinpoensis]MCA0991768.1 YjdJ family protein [Pseudalkalibacillus hwajinpoensis]